MTNNTKALLKGQKLSEGDTLQDFRGDDWQFIEVTRGPSVGRSAKVLVQNGTDNREFYSTVFPGLEVLEEPLDCCDGTGWTGDPHERCVTHYQPHGLEEFGFQGVNY